LDACWTDFACPPPVVVPSPAVAKWLKLRLCEARGPLVGLPTPTLESFLWASLEPPPGSAILRVEALQQALIPLLDQDRLASDAFEPVRAYLSTDRGIDAKRRVQLAHELARLFLEYEYNRPSVWKEGRWAVSGIDQSWPHRSYFGKAGEESVTEAWQRELHGAVFSEEGPLADGRLLGLPRLHRMRRDAGWRPRGGPALVFCLDMVSHFHRNLLLELSEEREIHLFLVNPCAEFWEDVDTSRRRGKRSRSRPARLAPADYQSAGLSTAHCPDLERDPFLLRRWGGASRESLVLWSQATDYDFEFSVEPPVARNDPATVLGALQQALVRRSPGPLVEPMELEDGRILSGELPSDGSIVLLECPERSREMEAIRDRLFDWLSEDPARKISDAVVLLADPQRHLAAIHKVFGSHGPGDSGYLPWVVLGEAAGASQWARAVRSLLSLARGRADRPAVFSLLRNPLVQTKLGLDGPTVARWEEWAESTGMIRAWDAAHRRELGDGPEIAADVHTFRAGWLRLALAPLVDGAVGLGLDNAQGLPDRLPVVRDFTTDPTEVDAFGACLERLLHQSRAFAENCRTCAPTELGSRLVEWVDRWVDFGDDAESRIRAGLVGGLEHLSLQAMAGRERMDLEELEEVVATLLETELPGGARAFAGALTFAPLRGGHVLPHGLVVLAGFDSDAFPGESLRTRLDLRVQARILGDADPVADNRALFLQAVLSARSRLVVAWRGRDIQRDESLEPSSVVLELEEALAAISGDGFRCVVPLLARESRPLSADRAGISWDPADALLPVRPSGIAWIPSARSGQGPIRVSVQELRSFLANPFLHRLRRVQGWADDEDPGTLDASHEVLGASRLDEAAWKSRLLTEIAREVWRGSRGNASVRALELAGTLSWDRGFPESHLAGIQARDLSAWAEGAESSLVSLQERFAGHRLVMDADLGLGGHAEPSTWETTLREAKVRLTGQVGMALVPSDPASPLVLVHCGAVEPGNSRRKAGVEIAKSWGVHLLAMAIARCGWRGPILVATIGRETPTDVVVESARQAPPGWWEHLLGDFLEERCEYLPAREILARGLADLDVAELRESLDARAGQEHAPPPDLLERLFEPLLPGEESGDGRILAELATRRLGPFVEVDLG